MREPRPEWSPLGVNFKILDEHPHLFYIRVPPPPPPSPGLFTLLVSMLPPGHIGLHTDFNLLSLKRHMIHV